MTDAVIRVENLGKKYVIGHQKQERYLTLRDAIAQTTRSLGRNFLPARHKEKPSNQEEFWALKDVSFEIKQGDRVNVKNKLYRRTEFAFHLRCVKCF